MSFSQAALTIFPLSFFFFLKFEYDVSQCECVRECVIYPA